MKFHPTPLTGAYVIELEKRQDSRGYFARTFCEQEMSALEGFDRVAQCNVSHNLRRGTLRGMHFQREPHLEAKIVTCVRGAIWDVIVDLRRNSPTLGGWFAQELTQDNMLSLYVPKGFAHGFQTLSDDSTVFYYMSEPYQPQGAAGIRWDDRDVAIAWPDMSPTLSERDAALPALSAWLASEDSLGSEKAG